MRPLSPTSVSPASAKTASDAWARDPRGEPARPRPSRGGWAAGPPTEAVAELLRTLELTINGRLDGVLHGNYQGLTPGHGSEPGESRQYQPGDDVRRIDWNITARTNETYVREQIADRDLTAWLVVDASATMQFGTVANDKAQTAMAAAACVGFLTARSQNRLGAVLVAGPSIHVIPPRNGSNQVRAILSTLARAADVGGAGPRRPRRSARPGRCAGQAARLHRRDLRLPRRRLESAHSVDCRMRHDLLAITVNDPREFDIPPIGMVDVVDPATGAVREVRVTAAVQRRYADAAEAMRTDRDAALGRTGADTIALDDRRRLAGHDRQPHATQADPSRARRR